MMAMALVGVAVLALVCLVMLHEAPPPFPSLRPRPGRVDARNHRAEQASTRGGRAEDAADDHGIARSGDVGIPRSSETDA